MSLSVVRSVYLTGPTTGLPEYNLPTLDAATDELRSIGLFVVSVHELHESAYLAGILATDAVVVLPGWQDSPSCSIEVLYAEALGRPVWTIAEMRLAGGVPLVA